MCKAKTYRMTENLSTDYTNTQINDSIEADTLKVNYKRNQYTVHLAINIES